MKINKIKVNYGRTVQLVKYEPTRFDIELSATVDETDDIESSLNELRAEAKLRIKQWIKLEENGNNNGSLDDDIPY